MMTETGRVLLVVPRLNIGGAESHVVQVARGLKAAGWIVEVASGGGALAKELAKEGIEQHWLPVRWGYFFGVWRLRRIVRGKKYDLIHAHSNATGAIVAKVAEGHRIPWVYTAHTGIRPPRIEEFGKANRILAVSDFARRIVGERGASFWEEKRLLTLHNAIDCEYFSPDNRRQEIRKSWQVDEDTYVVGIVARLLKPDRKGHFDLLRVLARPEAAKWRLVIIGKAHWWYGGTRKVLSLAKKLGVVDRIIWTGHQVDVRSYVEGCDVVALPSLAESFGLALAEAMAMRKPVVAYGGTGTNEVVGENEGGYLVPTKDIDALAAALLRLSWPEARKEIGRAARQRIERLYGLPKFMEKLVEIYQEVIEEGYIRPDKK